MKNIISTLTEKVTLMKNNQNTTGTTDLKYEKVLDTKASIRQLKSDDGLCPLFEVIILKPPIKFKNTLFSALKWNNQDYSYKTQFREHKEKFLKGTVTRILD
ncbi:MAG: hypothetical protein LBI95_01990 [Holosporales bacterium]|jgi:hypothetical protein|nr:hypothetical protein [Holosporales bacterium]